ncbi:hypothetical protein QRX50_34455 [Amycolatopsis carbonis]|uniref:Uncharacterized protein n=1 Tax=Amycolatopsis carbonis TaxID=715471 RepID=A0A9Y2MPW7_9PSEU|nr:hypothetical protein [Amycolatopsis sp. 2-15]WIX76540.1 hypothetical protein QRX50_34455 [Amycolatopsis sp. 2-15]
MDEDRAGDRLLPGRFDYRGLVSESAVDCPPDATPVTPPPAAPVEVPGTFADPLRKVLATARTAMSRQGTTPPH